MRGALPHIGGGNLAGAPSSSYLRPSSRIPYVTRSFGAAEGIARIELRHAKTSHEIAFPRDCGTATSPGDVVLTGVDHERLSRTVAHALRHEPWLYELELDEEGGAPLDQLLEALRRDRPAWSDLEVEDLREMIRRSDRRRYEIRGGRIRALYGHSLPERLQKEPAEPPASLFHGTDPQAISAIRAEGLRPMGRQHVHLSVDRATAEEVGRRKAREPAILSVDAAAAHADGVTFYAGNEKVWLSDRVPPRYLTRS